MKKNLIIVGSIIVVLMLCLIIPQVNKAISVLGGKSLVGVTLVIDPGHGGYDPGARFNKTDEKILNLSISQKLKVLLEGAGAKVIMTREDDYDLASQDAKNHKREDFSKRVAILNDDKASAFVSIHLNSCLDSSVKGSEVYYQQGSYYSEELAKAIQLKLKSVSKSKLGVKPGNYFLLKNSDTLGVIIECGFMSNKVELEKLKDEKYQDDLAYAIYQGLSEFFNAIE